MIMVGMIVMAIGLAASIAIGIAGLVILWRFVMERIKRGLGAVYLPIGQTLKSHQGASRRLARLPAKQPIPQPPLARPPPLPVTEATAPRQTPVPPAVDDDRAKTVAFSRYNTEDEVDTESDEGGHRGTWDEDLQDGRSNISLEGDITPRPGAPRTTEPFRPPHGRRSFLHMFRKNKE